MAVPVPNFVASGSLLQSSSPQPHEYGPQEFFFFLSFFFSSYAARGCSVCLLFGLRDLLLPPTMGQSESRSRFYPYAFILDVFARELDSRIASNRMEAWPHAPQDKLLPRSKQKLSWQRLSKVKWFGLSMPLTPLMFFLSCEDIQSKSRRAPCAIACC